MQWNLIRLRKEHNLTQKQVAECLGIDLTTYIRKENDRSQFKANEMFALKTLFNKKVDEIFLPTNCINSAISERGETDEFANSSRAN
ncbi:MULTISPECIES: helix-turn-helix transcriptional regulator [Cytobacillus]|uniref:helix-turn-helix transcriptional regulator n=1 Tax=Cytobacillus TaxID=2675230 RepID=UPI0025A2A3CD|nr:helix-turn-helix transcriptional regulator [Cytobacillus kochii]MDM5208444.1 helix-turn-helix transcriptional regulator [Cytobacillus kochii]